MYPAIAADFGTESYQRFGDGYCNTASGMDWYWDQYIPNIADRSHPIASPLQADLDGQPRRW